jgi:hypothetical protein
MTGKYEITLENPANYARCVQAAKRLKLPYQSSTTFKSFA